MSLTQFAMRFRPVTLVVVVSLMVLGIVALFTLSRREDPDLQGRFVRVLAYYPGGGADQVENIVTEKLERTLLEVDDMKLVTSVSRPGIVDLEAEASDQVKDLKKFRDDIRNRVSDILPSLPKGVTSVEVNDRFTDTCTLILGVIKPGATDREREEIAKRVRDRLLRISDVTEVKLVGEQQQRIEVKLSTQRLSQFGIAPAQIAEAISRRNILPDSGGSIPLSSSRLSVQATGNLTSERDLNDLVIASPGGSPVYLHDLASVGRGYADPATYRMRVNGQPAVGVYVTMRKGRNVTELGAKAEIELKRLKAELPPDVQIVKVNDMPRSVERRMSEFWTNLITGIGLILGVMFLFMGFRSALVVGVMLPITIVGTFALMYLFGRDIQQISISALIIALGLVVDNSIVVVDNIERKLSEGLDPERAAIEGTDELRVPLLTSNLTTVASFAPILLLSGGVGEFIRDMGVVTSLATLVSLFFNLTVTPLISLYWLKPSEGNRMNPARRLTLAGVDKLRSFTGFLALRGIKYHRITLLAATLGLAGAIAILPTLGTQFFPSAERNQFLVDVWLPEGRDIKATENTAKKVEALLQKRGEIESFVTYVGQGGPRFYYNVLSEPPTQNYAQIVVNTRSMEITHRLVSELQKEADAKVSDARVTIKTLEQGPPIGAPVAVRVSGDSIPELRGEAEKIKAILNSTPGAASVYNNYGELPLALKTEVNEEQARLAGYSATDIAQATQMATNGLTVANLREGDKEIPIQLDLIDEERGGVGSIENLYLPSVNGSAVPLRQVATLSLTPQEGRIVRRNHTRTLTVYAYSDGSRLASAILSDARKRIESATLPAGISIGYGGEQEETTRSFTELLLILGLTIMANLIIVAWEFNSFRAALTILSVIPFSLIGAVLGLWISHQPFGFMAFLGVTSLAGVVTNHAIVFFEYAMEERKHGLSTDDALLSAGKKRLRPILLTVALSIFGVLPQAFNGGSLWPPLAWAIIFGLGASLILTLVVVPTVYKSLGFLEPKEPPHHPSNPLLLPIETPSSSPQPPSSPSWGEEGGFQSLIGGYLSEP